ncbi:hypothetical protein SNOG_14987 [Parastagonospora nodorum SN15]|uniref:Uncharacterized protein n=1 Tax=Phaeosphaeria nodorum (strain SN15 / ATCC MYA-4574 / FGSC 10173) TaxID=321614 RepID=Q0TZI3_PHANO|nr:hypothetical protein SNOG_14987 [Parastagonospora nodorum SN15]EAT77530.1 hypothetical protein SNOG_14987 [Parastagonospora nodorum SN15]
MSPGAMAWAEREEECRGRTNLSSRCLLADSGRAAGGDKRTRFRIPTSLYLPVAAGSQQQLSAAAANDGWGKVRSGDWEARVRAPAASMGTCPSLQDPRARLVLPWCTVLAAFPSIACRIGRKSALDWGRRSAPPPPPPPRICWPIKLPFRRPAALPTMTTVSIYQHSEEPGTPPS